jgi:hypothetical protein
MQIDISRDFLDGIMLNQPPVQKDGNVEIRAGGQLHFLPSSPDGTMHTAVVGFALFTGAEGQQQNEKPFAQGGWRFLFTTDEKFDPKANPNHPFFGSMLMIGSGKIMAVLNGLCMHANLPLIPFDPSRMNVQQAAPQGGAPQAAAQQG